MYERHTSESPVRQTEYHSNKTEWSNLCQCIVSDNGVLVFDMKQYVNTLGSNDQNISLSNKAPGQSPQSSPQQTRQSNQKVNLNSKLDGKQE